MEAFKSGLYTISKKKRKPEATLSQSSFTQPQLFSQQSGTQAQENRSNLRKPSMQSPQIGTQNQEKIQRCNQPKYQFGSWLLIIIFGTYLIINFQCNNKQYKLFNQLILTTKIQGIGNSFPVVRPEALFFRNIGNIPLCSRHSYQGVPSLWAARLTTSQRYKEKEDDTKKFTHQIKTHISEENYRRQSKFIIRLEVSDLNINQKISYDQLIKVAVNLSKKVK